MARPGPGGCWPSTAAHGPARRALGQMHPCCSPSVLGCRGCSMALCPSWGSPHCCCQEKGQAEIKHSCAVPLRPSSTPHSTSHLSLRGCPPHGPGGTRGQASAFLHQVCLAGAVAGHCGSPAPGISVDRLSPVLTPHAQDPAVLSKATPLGALGTGPLFYSCF